MEWPQPVSRALHDRILVNSSLAQNIGQSTGGMGCICASDETGAVILCRDIAEGDNTVTELGCAGELELQVSRIDAFE
jgi:hypothetical protein